MRFPKGVFFKYECPICGKCDAVRVWGDTAAIWERESRGQLIISCSRCKKAWPPENRGATNSWPLGGDGDEPGDVVSAPEGEEKRARRAILDELTAETERLGLYPPVKKK